MLKGKSVGVADGMGVSGGAGVSEGAGEAVGSAPWAVGRAVESGRADAAGAAIGMALAGPGGGKGPTPTPTAGVTPAALLAAPAGLDSVDFSNASYTAQGTHPGETVTYTLVVPNGGSAPALAAEVKTHVPGNTSYVP